MKLTLARNRVLVGALVLGALLLLYALIMGSTFNSLEAQMGLFFVAMYPVTLACEYASRRWG